MIDASPLLELYSEYMTTIQENRLNALRQAILWFEEVIEDEARSHFSESEDNRFRQAAKARNLALNEATPVNEAEAAALMTLRLYERLLARFGFNGRTVDEVIKLYELTEESIKIQEKTDDLLCEPLMKGINQVFSQFQLSFAIAYRAKKRREIIPNKSIIFSVAYVKELREMAEILGIFTVMLNEILPILAKAMSYEREGSKHGEESFRLSAAMLASNIEVLSAHLSKFAVSSGIVADIPLTSFAASRQTQAPFNEWFRGKPAEVYNFLSTQIGNPIPYAVLKGLGGSRTDEILEFIQTVGERTQKFKLFIVRKFYVRFAIL